MMATEQTSAPTALALHASPEVAANAARWYVLRGVPLRLSVDIALPPMSLRALRALAPGQVLSSVIATADDLTVTIGGAPVCQARFEYLDGRMSIRVTRLLGAAAAGVPAAQPPAPSAERPA